MTVHSHSYYGEYFGHPVRDLEEVVQTLRAQGKHLVWTAGDSSLDNKVWFNESHDAVNGYESILRPPIMKADVTYWLNKFMAERGSAGRAAPLAAVNTAIEATSLNDRACTRLLAQDRLIRDHIGRDDVLIVSVGGNDVALQPLLCTCASMCALVYCGGPVACIERCACAFPPNSGVLGELGCLACGVPNCVTGGLCGWPIGFPYMVDLFKHRVGNYVRRLVAKTKPRKVLICMIYRASERCRLLRAPSAPSFAHASRRAQISTRSRRARGRTEPFRACATTHAQAGFKRASRPPSSTPHLRFRLTAPRSFLSRSSECWTARLRATTASALSRVHRAVARWRRRCSTSQPPRRAPRSATSSRRRAQSGWLVRGSGIGSGKARGGAADAASSLEWISEQPPQVQG